MVTVAIDVMGGDHGPRVTIPAALALLKEVSNVKVILVGLSEAIDAQLRLHKAQNHPRISIQHASEVVFMDESPQSALKNKKDSSMRVAINLGNPVLVLLVCRLRRLSRSEPRMEFRGSAAVRRWRGRRTDHPAPRPHTVPAG